MTLLSSTFLIYFLIGLGVALAVYLSDMARTPVERSFQTATCLVFWPLFLPLLLQRVPRVRDAIDDRPQPVDEMARAIQQVESELFAALRAADAFDGMNGRVEKLHMRWQAKAARIREMDRLLVSPEYSVPNDAIQAERPTVRDGANHPERFGAGSNAMSAIVEKLRQVRQQTHTDLMESLARARQLAAMLQLARFTGDPVPRTGEFLQEMEAELDQATIPDETIPCAADGTSSRE
jgi:hypothetical protein